MTSSYNEKVKFARKMFRKHARSIMMNKSIKTVFDAANNLYNDGVRNITMVVGSDRVREFKVLLNNYNGKKAIADKEVKKGNAEGDKKLEGEG